MFHIIAAKKVGEKAEADLPASRDKLNSQSGAVYPIEKNGVWSARRPVFGSRKEDEGKGLNTMERFLGGVREPKHKGGKKEEMVHFSRKNPNFRVTMEKSTRKLGLCDKGYDRRPTTTVWTGKVIPVSRKETTSKTEEPRCKYGKQKSQPSAAPDGPERPSTPPRIDTPHR